MAMFNSYAKLPEGNMRLCFGSHENVEIQPGVTVVLAALLIFFWRQQVCECALLARKKKPNKNCNFWLIITWKWKYSPNSPFINHDMQRGIMHGPTTATQICVPVPRDLDLSGLKPSVVKNCYVPSGNLTVSYWKWPSRNSGFSD